MTFPTSAPIFIGDTDQIGLVYGIRPQSLQEWYTALALWEVGWRFLYQVPIRGGRIPGGQVLDFLVDRPPTPQPLQVFSNYYHSGNIGSEDTFKLMVIQEEFGVEPIVLWSVDLMTKEAAVTAVVRSLGRPG